MLDGRNDNLAAPEAIPQGRPTQSKLDRLGSAAGKNKLVRRGAQQQTDFFAGSFHDRAGVSTQPVEAVRISIFLCGVDPHALPYILAAGGRGRMIAIVLLHPRSPWDDAVVPTFSSFILANRA